jgi:hypothetical protein
MPDLLIAIAIVFALVVLDVAAQRYGRDTRFDWRNDVRNTWW